MLMYHAKIVGKDLFMYLLLFYLFKTTFCEPEFFTVVIGNAMAELGRLLMYEASRDWLVRCCIVHPLAVMMLLLFLVYMRASIHPLCQEVGLLLGESGPGGLSLKPY